MSGMVIPFSKNCGILVSKKAKEREGMSTVTVIQPTITEEQNTKIRCAAYCRVSSDSEDQLNSFMAQTRYYSHFLRIRKQRN